MREIIIHSISPLRWYIDHGIHAAYGRKYCGTDARTGPAAQQLDLAYQTAAIRIRGLDPQRKPRSSCKNIPHHVSAAFESQLKIVIGCRVDAPLTKRIVDTGSRQACREHTRAVLIRHPEICV